MDQTTSIDASGRLVRCCKCVCPWTMSTSATGGGLLGNAEPEVPLQTCRIEYLPLRVLQVIHARVHSVVQTLARQRREGQSVLPRETGPGGGASSQLCDSPRYPPPHTHTCTTFGFTAVAAVSSPPLPRAQLLRREC